MVQPRPLFVYFLLVKPTLQFLQQIHVKYVHPVYVTGIRTHNLQNVSLQLRTAFFDQNYQLHLPIWYRLSVRKNKGVEG